MDYGIISLFLSVFLEFELHRKIQTFITESNWDVRSYYKKFGKYMRKKKNFYNLFGFFTFFIGMMFLFLSFNLIVLVYGLLIFLNIKWIILLIKLSMEIKELGKNPVKYNGIDVTKEVKKTKKYYSYYSIFMGVVLVIITIFVFKTLWP